MFQDLRFGLRMLLKQPGFTLVVILTLALGIGANTAIFSVVNALMLRPLPYRNPERLVRIEEVSKTFPSHPVFGAHFLDWREQCRTLEAVAAYGAASRTLTGAGEPERVECGEVSASFFPLLGAQPQLGRNFTEAEDKAGGERVVILGHGLWRRRYNSDPAIVGRGVTLDDASYTVVGVLPDDFRFFQPFELWKPLILDPQVERGNQRATLLSVLARLKPGATLEEARAETELIRQRYETTKPQGMPVADGHTRVIPLREKLLGDTRRALLMLLGATGLVLLIACANVANLLLARALTRRKELAIRAALGASRFRLARQMISECLLLAGAGGAAGLLLAYCLTRLLGTLNPIDALGDLARLSAVTIDLRALGFTLLVSLLTGLLCGLLPALEFSRPDLNASLKEGGRSGGFHGQGLRGVLMASEIALAMVLLAGAGLLIRSFVKLLEVDQGYRAENLLTARITLPPRYDEKSQRAQFYEQTLQRMAALPGVSAVGATSLLPLTRKNMAGWLRVENRPPEEGRREPPVFIGAVNADYFRAMGIGLRAGRLFNDGDRGDAPGVAILSEELARKLFPDEDPLGKRLFIPTSGAEMVTVIGVVGDVRHKGLDQGLEPAAYLHYRQSPPPWMTLVIRGAGEPLGLAPALRAAVQAVDPALPLYEVMTMSERMETSLAARRLNLLLLGVFAALALLLAGVGVYGVIAYLVSQRAHEIGIRMALGAQASDVLRMVVWQGMRLTLIGVALGLAAALALTRVMKNLLFNVSANDPATFAGIALLLAGVALIASYIPARRATKVDPLLALRHE
jgi:putative ABC transport system permease protein